MMKEVTVDELKKMIDSGAQFQLIDVREEFEYDTSNLGGKNIPLADILLEKDEIDRDKPVVIHCRSGKRSAQAVQLLQQAGGFDNLSNLKGGILAWKETFDPDMVVY